MLFILHREYLSIKYYSTNILSISFLVNYLLIKLVLTIPFIVIYKSGGLWSKIEFNEEKPEIKFKHDLFLMMNFVNKNNPKLDKMFYWSNLAEFKIDSNFIKIPSIDNIEYDYNDDNLNDRLKLDLNIRSIDEYQLNTVRCILPFYFKIKKYAHLEMEGLIDVKINTNANNHIILKSSINFKQRNLIDANSILIIDNMFNIDKILDNIDEFISNYKANNYTLDYTDLNLEFKKTDNINNYKIELNFDYLNLIFKMKPKFWTMIKLAWIQYLAILIVIYYFYYKIKQLLFEEQLLLTNVSLSNNFNNLQKYFTRKF